MDVTTGRYWIGAVAVVLIMSYVFLASLNLMNILTGVLVEVVSAMKKVELDNADINVLKRTILLMLKALDADDDGKMSPEEIDVVLHDEDALRVFRNLEVDVQHLKGTFWYKFMHVRSIPLADCVSAVLSCRGNRDIKMQ